jgi:hypothetical protein
MSGEKIDTSQEPDENEFLERNAALRRLELEREKEAAIAVARFLQNAGLAMREKEPSNDGSEVMEASETSQAA